MTDKLAPADDPRVLAFRRLLVRQDEWAALNDPASRYAVGGEIVADTSRLIRASGLGGPAYERFLVDVQDGDDHTALDTTAAEAAGAPGLLRGLAQLSLDWLSAVLPPRLAELYAGDALLSSQGNLSLIAARVPRQNRQRERPMLFDDIRQRAVLYSHFVAGRDGGSWLTVLRPIAPMLSDEGLRKWNGLIPKRARDHVRAIGNMVAMGIALTMRDALFRDYVTRYPPADLRDGIKRGGSDQP